MDWPFLSIQKGLLMLNSNDGGEDRHRDAIDIYKMEYERCAQRYNDLYNAAWTNFSYMALISGGVLTFGGTRFVDYSVTAFLACLPLLFWWLATFEPLNRYGDDVLKELCQVEQSLNALFVSEYLPEKARKGLTHFQKFAEPARGFRRYHRVRYVVRIAAIILLLTMFALAIRIGCLVLRGQSLTASASTSAPSPTPWPSPFPTERAVK
jgi:hypothetical protein